MEKFRVKGLKREDSGTAVDERDSNGSHWLFIEWDKTGMGWVHKDDVQVIEKEQEMTDAQFLEKLLASERPCEEYATHYLFFFVSDTGRELYLDVRRDYSNSEFGEWVIEGTQIC